MQLLQVSQIYSSFSCFKDRLCGHISKHHSYQILVHFTAKCATAELLSKQLEWLSAPVILWSYRILGVNARFIFINPPWYKVFQEELMRILCGRGIETLGTFTFFLLTFQVLRIFCLNLCSYLYLSIISLLSKPHLIYSHSIKGGQAEIYRAFLKNQRRETKKVSR